MANTVPLGFQTMSTGWLTDWKDVITLAVDGSNTRTPPLESEMAIFLASEETAKAIAWSVGAFARISAIPSKTFSPNITTSPFSSPAS